MDYHEYAEHNSLHAVNSDEPQTLFDIDNCKDLGFANSKRDQTFKKADQQRDAKIASSIDKINKRMQRQSMIKSLPQTATHQILPQADPLEIGGQAAHSPTGPQKTPMRVAPAFRYQQQIRGTLHNNFVPVPEH